MEEETYIRAPDAPIRERLLDDNSFLDEENQIKSILEMSESEYIYQQYQEIQQAQQKRYDECEQLTIKVNKMRAFDKKNLNIYETILTAFSLYQSGELDIYPVSSLEEYERIMYVVISIRLTEEERAFITRLVTYFDNCV